MVLIVAGLDPSGGAGLIADVATVVAAGLHPAAIATALTVQDSARCHSFRAMAAELVGAQLDALIADLPIAAVKIGMLGDGAVAREVARALAPLVARGVPLVLDPVLRASFGAVLLDGDPLAALGPLLPLAELITPNRDEAQALTGRPVEDRAGQLAAAKAVRALGPRAVLVKGGHLEGDPVIDLLLDEGEPLLFSSPRRPGTTPHGTGCALSTEIACALALGQSLRAAVVRAHRRVADRIAGARPVGRGRPFLRLR